MTDFEYVKSINRYRWKDSKQFLSQDLVKTLTDKNISKAHDRAIALTDNMLKGNLTVSDWEIDFAKEIKTITIQEYKLGRGWDLNQTDNGRIGGYLRYQYGKLRDFSNEIIAGDVSDARIRQRAKQYLNRGRQAYEEANRKSNYDSGNSWERRRSRANESCISCLVYEALGWQAINTLPAIATKCKCGSNCQCYFEFSNSVVKPTTSILDTNYGWISIQTKKEMKITINAPEIKTTSDINPEELAKVIANATADLQSDGEVVVEQTNMRYGTPNAEQLAKINSFRPLGSPEYKANQIISVPFAASNNFLQHSQRAWTINVLNQMAEQYPGRPFELNHDLYQAKSIRGLVYDAEVIKSDRVPEKILNHLDREINESIFQNNGFVQLITHVFFEASTEYASDIYYRRTGDVSTHFKSDGECYCPIDGTRFGDGENFYTCAEGHTLPYPFYVKWYYDEDELSRLAPYYLVDNVTYTIELSQVVVGDLPAAGILING